MLVWRNRQYAAHLKCVGEIRAGSNPATSTKDNAVGEFCLIKIERIAVHSIDDQTSDRVIRIF